MVTGSNPTPITGVNAAFIRTETIANANEAKSITIDVTWSDINSDDRQTVSIDSSIAWQKTSQIAAPIDSNVDPLIPSSTGRAKLGDGTLTLAELDAATATDDGMFLYDSLDGQYRLVDKNRTIVLTLIDACDLDTKVCTDFVKISGRVYIDNTNANVPPGELFVKASDAAYCHQYLDNNDELLAGDTTANTTTNGNYTYYNYTCYLGGGWHGNIGIIKKGGINPSDKDVICQGDPTSGDAGKDAVISAKRIYRGMLTKTGTTQYTSIGVKDALVLPATGDAGHDFVISKYNSTVTADKCKNEVMVRPDSAIGGISGKLFEGVPTDFFCLNQNVNYIDLTGGVPTGYTLENPCPINLSNTP